MKKIAWDIEATNLLNESSIDYTSVPYKLKDSYKIHCIVVIFDNKIIGFHDGEKFDFTQGSPFNIDLGPYSYVFKDYVPLDYIHRSLGDFTKFIEWLPEGSTIIAHNQINYDLLAVKLYYGIDYKVEVEMSTPLGDDVWAGKQVNFDDTMIRSKVLNPDRFGGHSLDNLASKGEDKKMEFRYHVSKDSRFKKFGPDMLYYNILDVKANIAVADLLDEEMKLWDWNEKWEPALKLEKQVAELVTRQEHRGFHFDKELAEENLKTLDEMMEERRVKIEAILPPRPATKSFMKDYTPPKLQFKKSTGEPSANMVKFAQRLGGTIEETDLGYVFNWEGKQLSLPLPEDVPLIQEMRATINDTTHIKEWLVGLGWKVLEYKEKDLTVGAGKIKLPVEKLKAGIDRYIEQTINSNFMYDRMDFLEIPYKKNISKEQARLKLQNYFNKRMERSGGIKVQTNPSFTTGQEKEVCKNLRALAESSEELRCITDITEYLTYRHRRNSILGGGVSFEDFEDEDDEQSAKGYLANLREDGRIPTPAGTCDAATSRMRHRLVVNVPRSTSLFGEQMRGMFRADGDVSWQLGYDFASLEAVIESHNCYQYESDPEKSYCNSLVQEKPNDVHTKMSKRISEIIGQDFGRSPAKNVKYGCLPTDSTEVLTDSGWKYFDDVFEGDTVLGYNASTGSNEWTTVNKTHFFKDAYVKQFGNTTWNVEATLDHRWYGMILKQYGHRQNSRKVIEPRIFTTEEIKQTHYILNTAPYVGGDSTVTPDEAALIAWVLADGYYAWSEKEERTSCSGGKKKGLVASISQAEHKYQSEIVRVLEANGMEYHTNISKNNNFYKVTNYNLRAKTFRPFLDRVVGSRAQKHNVDWCTWLLKLSKESLESFMYAFWLADGDSKGNENATAWTFKQNEGNIADALVLCGYLLGWNVTYRGKGKCKGIRFQKKRPHATAQEFRQLGERYTDVFCLTTGTDNFIIRQNGIITITGNCTYGAQAAKVAKTIGAPLEVGQQVFDAFWQAAEPLALLKKALQREWENNFQKKRIQGIDGRLVPTRSAHAILNSLLQGGGVVCAKKVMVYHDRLAAEEGYIVDFFKDALPKDRKYWQQMIAMHDEAQGEVDKGSVKFKLFKTEQEAVDFKKAQAEIWSDVQHSDKGWFVGYCRQGELMAIAVEKVNRDFNMNMPLSAGYVLGLNWHMCH